MVTYYNLGKMTYQNHLIYISLLFLAGACVCVSTFFECTHTYFFFQNKILVYVFMHDINAFQNGRGDFHKIWKSLID